MFHLQAQAHVDPNQGPTSTLYSNRTRIFLSYSNPTRKILKNDRVASSVYFSHFREIAARPASQYYSLMDTALVEILSFILSLSSATSKTQTYFQHINVFVMLLTIIITMVIITGRRGRKKEAQPRQKKQQKEADAHARIGPTPHSYRQVPGVRYIIQLPIHTYTHNIYHV